MNSKEEKALRTKLKSKKKRIVVYHKEAYYLFEQNLPKLIEELLEIQRKAIEDENLTNIDIDIENEEGYYNQQTIMVTIYGYRNYTDADIDEEIKAKKELFSMQEQNNRKLYEKLKKQFEKVDKD